jgi:hypothetical protein
MAPTVEPEHLNNHHRNTLREIMHRPADRNIEWHSVVSLLGAVGSIEERHNGKFDVTVGSQRAVLQRPPHKDIDPQTVTDVRRLLLADGYGPEPDDN